MFMLYMFLRIIKFDSGRRYNQDFESHPFYSICKNKEEKNTMFDNIKVKKQDSVKIKEKTDDGSLENIYHKIRYPPGLNNTRSGTHQD